MKTITWAEFEGVDIRVWTIIEVRDFPEARNPAYKVWVDFGEEFWIKKTSAQITRLYTKEELLWKQILGVVNFEPKQIGSFMSEFLITGIHTDAWVVVSGLERCVKNWLRLI
jgi:tRNA-binding protein